MQPLRYAWAWLLAGLLILAMGLASALLPVSASLAPVNDKVLHGVGFVGIMLWFGGVFERRRLPWVALGLAAYGLLIEVLQSLTPSRQAEGLDLAADMAGILLGWLLCVAGFSRWCTTLESWLARPNP